MKKGIIIRYLCQNPACNYSSTILKTKEPVNIGGNKGSFKILNSCPKCKSSVEMLDFTSGSIEITPDIISEEK